MRVVVDQGWTSTGSSGALAAIEIKSPPSQSVLYCECSTIASTQSFAFQTAAHSSGPWVTELSTSVPATGAVTGAAVLRLTGPYGYVRPYLNSASTGDYSFRLIGVD